MSIFRNTKKKLFLLLERKNVPKMFYMNNFQTSASLGWLLEQFFSIGLMVRFNDAWLSGKTIYILIYVHFLPVDFTMKCIGLDL